MDTKELKMKWETRKNSPGCERLVMGKITVAYYSHSLPRYIDYCMTIDLTGLKKEFAVYEFMETEIDEAKQRAENSVRNWFNLVLNQGEDNG